MAAQTVPDVWCKMQVLPRASRLAPRAARLHSLAASRTPLVVQAHTAASADTTVTTAAARQLPTGPSFQYFLHPLSQPTVGSVDRPTQSASSASARKVYIETYGCQMNVNDSEVLLSVLADNGYAQTQQDTDADVIFLNTCAIREQAEQRIWSRLAVLKSLKNKNKTR